MHWRDPRYQTPLAVRPTSISVARIWSVLALLCLALLLAVVLLA